MNSFPWYRRHRPQLRSLLAASPPFSPSSVDALWETLETSPVLIPWECNDRYMVDLLQNMCRKNTWTFAPSLEADEEIDGLDRFVRVFLRGPGSHETEQSQWPKIFLRLLGWWPWCGAVVTQLDMFWRVFPCDWNSPPLLGICSTSTGSGLICHSGWSIEDGSWLQHMVLESS